MEVISLGGSMIVPDEINIDFLKKFVEFIKADKRKFIIVCGGGKTCRRYLEAMNLFNINDMDKDLVGIRATQLNAEFLRTLFEGLAHDKVACDYTKKIDFNKVLVASGWKPGCSTDLDAVEFAHTYGCARVINLTNVDFVYDKNPKFSDAKPIKRLSWDEYFNIIGNKFKPGMHAPFDPVAAEKAKEYEIRVVVLSGLDNLRNLLNGKEFKGSVIF